MLSIIWQWDKLTRISFVKLRLAAQPVKSAEARWCAIIFLQTETFGCQFKEANNSVIQRKPLKTVWDLLLNVRHSTQSNFLFISVLFIHSQVIIKRVWKAKEHMCIFFWRGGYFYSHLSKNSVKVNYLNKTYSSTYTCYQCILLRKECDVVKL